MKKLFLFRLLLTGLLVLTIGSCAQQETKGVKKRFAAKTILGPGPGSDTGRSEYNSLEKSYEDKKYSEYLANSNNFQKKYEDSKYTPAVIYKRGTILLSSQRYSDASNEFNKIVSSYRDSNQYNNAVYYSAICEHKQGNSNEALSILSKADLGRSDLDADSKIKILVLQGNIYTSMLESGKAFESYADAYRLCLDDALRSKLKVSMLSEIDKTKTEDLEYMKKKYSGDDFNSYIVFELGERYMQKGNSIKARDEFTTFLSNYPQHEYAVQVETYMSRIKSIDQVDPYTIGVVLPLTGKNAAFGQKSLMGIQLAAGVFGDNKNTRTPVKLAVMDSQSDPEVARMAVEKLLQEDHVIAIVGPLGSDEAEATATQCNMSGIPNISLSQKDDLSGLGQYIYRMAMSNRNQIRRLVDYSMNKLSIKRFAVLSPDDKYGQELTKYFWDEVVRKGGEITAAESYQTQQTDFREQVKKLLGVYYVGARMKEYNELKAEMEADPKRKNKINDLTLPPVNSFEALFIPDDARIAAQIAPYLPYYDAKGIVLMGPNTWNSPQLISRGQDNVNGAIFVDGFTPLASAQESRAFVKNFKDAFNTMPGVLEAQGYDALNIVVTAMNKAISSNGVNGLNRETLKGYINGIGSFAGATGKMSIENNGEIDKQLFVLGVERGKIILKD